MATSGEREMTEEDVYRLDKSGGFADVEEYLAVDDQWELRERLAGFRSWAGDHVAATVWSMETGKPETERAAAWARRADVDQARPQARSLELRAFAQNDRARRLGIKGSVNAGDWRHLVQHFRHRCAYCGIPGGTHMDHVVPLARGGRHAITNVAPACRRCNATKQAKTLEAWAEARGFDVAAIRQRLEEGWAIFGEAGGSA